MYVKLIAIDGQYWTVEEKERENEGRIRRSLDTQQQVGVWLQIPFYLPHSESFRTFLVTY